MEPKPKERIVFDEDPYYGAEGEKMAAIPFRGKRKKPPYRASLSRRTGKPPSM